MNDNYRYRGTQPFENTQVHRLLFFGRKKETESLLHYILKDNLVVLYGKPGSGKTSLINAGLLQTLHDKGFIPLIVRFDHQTVKPMETVFNSIDIVGPRLLQSYKTGHRDSLGRFFETAVFPGPNGERLTPVVIFDQFEEFFSLYSPETGTEFTLQLARLVNHVNLDIKIIISLRENYLRRLNDMTDHMPCILDKHWYELLPPDRARAVQAITQPARIMDPDICTPPFIFSPDAIDMIMDFLSTHDLEENVETEEFDFSQLQLLCRYLENNIREKQGMNEELVITADDIPGGKAGLRQVMQQFYLDRLKQLKPGLEKYRVRRLIERGLIRTRYRTEERKHQYPYLNEEEIRESFGVSESLLTQLVNLRLLHPEYRNGTTYYRLSRMLTAAPIRETQKKYLFKWTVILTVLALCVAAIAIIAFPSHRSRFETAVQKYREIIKSDKTNSRSYQELARLLYSRGRFAEAALNFTEALKLDKTNPDLYKKLAWTYIKNREPEKAVDVLRQAMAVNPEYVVIFRRIAQLIEKYDRKDMVEKVYEAVSQSGSRDAYNYIYIAHFLTEMGKYDAAFENYRKPFLVKSRYFYVYNNSGRLLERLGMHRTDFEIFISGNTVDRNSPDASVEVIDKNTADAFALYNLGARLFGLRQFAKAEESFKNALATVPSFLPAKACLAEIFMIKGRFDAALRLASQVLEAKNISLNYILAMRFVTLACRFFLGEVQPLGEYNRFNEYIDELENDPVFKNRHWSYKHALEFINGNKQLPPKQTALLRQLAERLEPPYLRDR